MAHDFLQPLTGSFAVRPLKAAEARGCRTADGLGMLVGPGVIGLKDWTGVGADTDVMR